MSAASSLIPELDDIVQNGTPARRAQAIARISDLFLQGAAQFKDAHVALFDDIFVGLVPATAVDTRAELAERLSRLSNAPPTLIRQLAQEDEVSVASPVLIRSPLLDDVTLVDIARRKGQGHLAAIAERAMLSTAITDVIVRRGDRDVVRGVAGNSGALFSGEGYSRLIGRATDDGTLALTVGQRDDVPPVLLKELLAKSADVVRRRLFEAAKPKQKAAINQAMLEISGAPKSQLMKRDFGPAQREILVLHRSGELNEAVLLSFAREHKYEESVAALAALTGMQVMTLHHLMLGDRYDPILLLGQSIGLEWATVRALLVLRLGPGKVPSAPDIEEARVNFNKLAPGTAQRVLAFWRAREKVQIAS